MGHTRWRVICLVVAAVAGLCAAEASSADEVVPEGKGAKRGGPGKAKTPAKADLKALLSSPVALSPPREMALA
jgi:hypothetical protein